MDAANLIRRQDDVGVAEGLRDGDRSSSFSGDNDILAASHLVLTADTHGYLFDLLACCQESLKIFFNGLSHFDVVLG